MILERRRLLICLSAACGLSLAACSRDGEGQPQVGGPFRLVDQDGRPRDQTMLKGRWSAVFFGYTYCPDVCPTTLQTLGEAQDRLGPRARDLQVVFVSVDPERDSPRRLKSYLANPAFPKGAVGLTGSPQAVAQIAKAYHLFYQKSGAGPDYEVQHSSAVYLMDRSGRFSRVVAYGLSPEETAGQIRQAMG